MKKLLYYICTATFLFALASCSNELETDGEVKGNTELSVTIGDNTTRVSVNQQIASRLSLWKATAEIKQESLLVI